MDIPTIIAELRRRARRLGGETEGSDGELMLHAASNLEGFCHREARRWERPELPLNLDDWELYSSEELVIPPGEGWWLLQSNPFGCVAVRRRNAP